MFEHLDDPNPPRPEVMRTRVLATLAVRSRNRRRAVVGIGGVAAAVAAVLVAAAMHSSGDRRLDVASRATTSSSADGSFGAVTVTTGTPGAAASSTSTTSGGGAARTRPGATPGPTDRRPTETVPPQTTTTAITDCGAGDLAVITTTDHGAYPYGGTVTVTVTVQNRSTRACIRPEPGYNADTVTIVDSNGNAVWDPPRSPPGIGVYHPPTAVAPGASYTYSTTSWDQRSCDATCSRPATGQPGQEGNQVPPGSYVARGHVTTADSQTLTTASQPFAIGPP